MPSLSLLLPVLSSVELHGGSILLFFVAGVQCVNHDSDMFAVCTQLEMPVSKELTAIGQS